MVTSDRLAVEVRAPQGTAGHRIRILVVDDSVVMRQLITRMLGAEAGFEVVGTARDGSDALVKIERLRPDVVTLDVEMPQLDGIGALHLIKQRCPSVRVIMCSSLTERGASVTIDALLAGADDYVTKLHSGMMAATAYEALQADLVRKIQQMFTAKTPAAVPKPAAKQAAPVASPVPVKQRRPEVLAIGVSTGGPAALAEVLPMIPADFPCPVVIVQHMPPFFTHLLAERLNKISNLSVLEATHGAEVIPGRVLIAPGDYHMRVVQQAGRIAVVLDQEAQENSCRPAVDVLFRSVAEVYGGAVLAVILTGMGQDGLLGARLLKSRGASVLVQDRATSVVWGMPGAAAEALLADAVLPLKQIVPEIMRYL